MEICVQIGNLETTPLLDFFMFHLISGNVFEENSDVPQNSMLWMQISHIQQTWPNCTLRDTDNFFGSDV